MMGLSCPLRTSCRVSQEKFNQTPYNTFFVDQVCTVKMADVGLVLFLRVYGLAKKELGQHPAILTEHTYIKAF